MGSGRHVGVVVALVVGLVGVGCGSGSSGEAGLASLGASPQWSYRVEMVSTTTDVATGEVVDVRQQWGDIVESEDGSFIGHFDLGFPASRDVTQAYDMQRGMSFLTHPPGQGEHSRVVGRACTGDIKATSPVDLMMSGRMPFFQPAGIESPLPASVEAVYRRSDQADYVVEVVSSGLAAPTAWPSEASYRTPGYRESQSEDDPGGVEDVRHELTVSAPVPDTGVSVSERIAELEEWIGQREAAGDYVRDGTWEGYEPVDDLTALAGGLSYAPVVLDAEGPGQWSLAQAFFSASTHRASGGGSGNPVSQESLVLCYRSGLRTMAIAHYATGDDTVPISLTAGGWSDPMDWQHPFEFWVYPSDLLGGLDLDVDVDPAALSVTSPIVVAPFQRPHIWGRRPGAVVAIYFEGPTNEFAQVLESLEPM